MLTRSGPIDQSLRFRAQLVGLACGVAMLFVITRGGWLKVFAFAAVCALVFALWPMLMGLRTLLRPSR